MNLNKTKITIIDVTPNKDIMTFVKILLEVLPIIASPSLEKYKEKIIRNAEITPYITKFTISILLHFPTN